MLGPDMIFECLPSTLSSNSSSWEMDHTRAVKDYQRSSADQPVPLPRELRPTHVLQRTMAYLLATIADRPEIDTTRSLWKPWYEFMWTRTRAIRKDIRQQNLCCPIVISVIERIARFHIFCAARLVDQPVDSFDPRINSENLTQCLQTLKEMYSDLDMLNSSSTSLLSSSSSSTSAEHLCPNEAEFRAYMLLMKLNDQNEINEAQRLPDRIRKSKPVRFAFAAHEALITNNYVRFFRLARLAQCLPACLMHRYFVQIRGQALTRLSYAFAGHPKREVHYPISTLTRQLGFENNTETKDFCERWGLTTDDSNVIFEKQVQPEPPELPWRENRSFQLIENKRIGTTLSELFNGSPINPSDAIPPPVKSSFDTNGMYIAGGQNTNVQTVTSNNDNNNNNMVVSSSGGFGNALFSNRITADDGSSSNNRNSNIINSTVDYSLSSSSLFPSFQQAKLNSSLITSQSSSSSSWLTGAANTQNKKPIDNQLVEQIFYECVVDDVMHFKELAESLLLQEMIIHEWIENLIETLFKEQLIEIYNKVIHPVNEMSKVMIESLINEIINEELYHIVQSEFILESLCNEIFDQLIKERLYKLTSSSLTKSLATSLYNANLIKYCVNHFRYLIWKREEAEQDEILLNRIGGKFLPNPYWSINLQYSLNWLEECFRRMLNRSPVDVRSWNHRRKCQINNASNNNRNHHIYSTTSLSSLSASTSASTVPAEVTVYTELSDLVDQYIDACFLRPLADLSAFWKSQDFVDPVS
ncbi:unnamed protein product [Trichobilharzia regenti]|nr:unnamed protein product [Trichobilharzia regenti]